VHADVFAVGHSKLVARGKLMAALLTCGPASFLSHRTAAALWGLRAMNTRRIHVTVPTGHAPDRPNLAVHRTQDRLGKGELVSRDGLRHSSLLRLLFELAPIETLRELDRLVTQAIRRNLLDLKAMEAMLHARGRRPGVAKLKQVLARYRPRPSSRSSLERDFDELIAGTDIPDPQRNVTIAGWELDRYWPEFQLAVELDGRPYHVAVRDMEKDKYKDAQLLLIGIHVMRITDFRFGLEPNQVRDDLRKLTR
jgi:hypothetical protein